MAASNFPVVIAIDGTSASGKSSNAKRVAQVLEYVFVDTGAMYRSLAWYCLRKRVDVHNEKAVAAACRSWKTNLVCTDGPLRAVRLLVDGYYPEKEIRTEETSAAVPHVAAVSKVRDWMKKKQRECVGFGNLVMEGRDIGTNVFPETDFKFYLDAHLEERTKRRDVDETISASEHHAVLPTERPAHWTHGVRQHLSGVAPGIAGEASCGGAVGDVAVAKHARAPLGPIGPDAPVSFQRQKLAG